MRIKKFLDFITENRKRLLVSIFALVVILSTIVVTTASLAMRKNVIAIASKNFFDNLGIYTEPISEVEIQSDDYDEPGSWHINKSAKWTGYGKAEIKFELETKLTVDEHKKDVILVLDRSGSMEGSRISRLQSDSNELVDYILNDEENRIAVIQFNDASEILTTFSNNKEEVLGHLNSLAAEGTTNYNAPYQNVDIVLEGYEKQDNKDLIMLFLTDGYPNIDIPNQIATYAMLKEKYPYMKIHGIQYEMGSEAVREIKQITDKQWNASVSTLRNALFDAVLEPLKYEDLTISDFIDDKFTVESIEDVTVDYGKTELSEEDGLQKVIWNLGGETFISGGKAEMTINVSLKEEYREQEGLYPTNNKVTVSTKLPEKDSVNFTSNNTPVLKNTYEVTYDTNTPEGCNLPNIPREKHYVYTNVNKAKEELTCNGYLFQGWELALSDDADIISVNDDVFIMPEHDVTIRATWSRQSIVKSMDGQVHQKTTLYKVLQNEAENGRLAKEYTGDHQDSFEGTGDKKIYHYYASYSSGATEIKNKNNVLFANQCWQMYRTTDTGGVKLLYNGEPDSNGICQGNSTPRPQSSMDIISKYYYGTNYIYNNTSDTYQISGIVEQSEWNDVTYNNLIGKYTCLSSDENDTCTDLYMIVNYIDNTRASGVKITSGKYNSIGVYGVGSRDQFLYSGYMYNKLHTFKHFKLDSGDYNPFQTTKFSTTYWYADSIEWNEEEKKYTLVNPYKISSSKDYESLKGKYTLFTTEEYSSSYAKYILGKSGYELMSYVTLYGGESIEEHWDKETTTYTFGSGVTENDDGSFLINDPITIKESEYFDFNKNGKDFLCVDAINNSCNFVRYMNGSKSYGGYYIINKNNNFKYATGFKYENGKYILTDNIVSYSEYLPQMNSNYLHYTCFNSTGICDELSYIIKDKQGVAGMYPLTYYYYVNLVGGEDIGDVIYESLHANDVNQKNSCLKTIVDSWYDTKLVRYTDYIEDTIYCNNRNISDLGALNPDNKIDADIVFSNSVKANSSLKCDSVTDQFSTMNSKALLKYPVGLMTIQEARTLGETIFYGHSMSPNGYDFYNESLSLEYYGLSGYPETSSYVRPVISLVPNIEYSLGDGSKDNPYIIDVDKGPKVTFDASGGNVSINSKSTIFYSPYGYLPTPVRGGFEFLGWFTEETGGEQVTSSTIVNNQDDHTLYAHWRKKTFITLDTQGGNEISNILYMDIGEKYNLPAPFKGGYKLTGWFTEPTGGTQVTNDTELLKLEDHTLYAQWQENGLPKFTVINDPHYFKPDAEGKVFTSNNQKKSSTTAKTTITFTENDSDGLTINWTVDSEERDEWSIDDCLTITYNGTRIVDRRSGKGSSKYKIRSISEGDTLVFEYEKNRSVDSGTDTATVTLS